MERFHKLGWTYSKNNTNHHQRTRTRPRKRQLLQCMDMFGACSRRISLVHISKKKGCISLFQVLLLAMSCLWKDSLHSLLVRGVCSKCVSLNNVSPIQRRTLDSLTRWNMFRDLLIQRIMNSWKFKFYFPHILNLYCYPQNIFCSATWLSQHILFFRNPGRKTTWECIKPCKQWDTPWKINMEHNHGGLEDHVPF